MINEVMLNVDQLSDTFKKNKSTIYRWVKAGKFPKPIKIQNSTMWRESEIKAFLDNGGKMGKMV